MAQELEAAPRVAAATFGDRLAEAVERKQQPAHRRARSRHRSASARAGAATRISAAPRRQRRSAASAAASSTPSPRTRSESSRSSLSSRRSAPTGCGRSRTCAPTRELRGLIVVADAKRGDIGSTVACVRGRLSRAARRPAAARRRDDRQPLPRPRLGRAAARSVPARGRGHLLPRQDLERGRRRHPGPRALGRAARSGSTSPGWSRSGARTSSASAASPASERSSERPIRARSARLGSSSRVRCSCSPGSARRVRARPTSPAPSRAGRQARSSPQPARCSMPSGRPTTTGDPRPRPRRPG